MLTPKSFPEMSALLIGATSGIGLETAAQLAEAGVPHILLCGRDPARGAQAIATVHARAPNADVRFYAGDASDPRVAAGAVQAAVDAGGGLDILMNAVPGVSPPRPFSQLDTAIFGELMQLHLGSVLHATHCALPHLIARGGGIVLNISSDAAKIPTPGESVHGALMAAIAMFSRTLALEEARHGVRVHALTPSIIGNTISYERMMADPFSEKLFRKASERAALGMPMPADVAAAAVFLCSPAAARMTGQMITVNGGLAVA